MQAKLPSSLQGAYIGAIVGSLLIGCCAAYSGLGVAMQQMSMGMLESSGADPQLSQMIELQRSMAIVSVITIVLQLTTSLVLAVGGGIGLSGRPIARPIVVAGAALVGLGVLVDLGTAVYAWSQAQGLYGVGGMPMGEDESRIVMLATAAGMAPTACWVFLKLIAASLLLAALFSTEAREFYARMGPEGFREGPRG